MHNLGDVIVVEPLKPKYTIHVIDQGLTTMLNSVGYLITETANGDAGAAP